MAQIKRLGFGVQALILLASENDYMTSADIAGRIHCEPTALRKVLGQLADAGLIEVKQGRSGGYRLKVQPDEISLSRVFQAVKDEEAEWYGILETINGSSAGRKIFDSYRQLLSEITDRIEQTLGAYTVADLME